MLLNAKASGGSFLPIVDETAIVYKTGTPANTLTFDVTAYTAARVVTWPDAAMTVAGLEVANVFTADQRIDGYKLVIGDNAPSADDSVLMFTRAISGANPSSHSIRDESTFTATVSGSYASIDSATVMSGAIALDHIASFQSRQTFNGSLSLNNSWGYRYQLIHTGAGDVSNAVGVYVLNPDLQSTGGIDRLAALWCDELTAATNNYCIYSPGATQSLHAGHFDFTNTITVTNQGKFGSVGIGDNTSIEKLKVNFSTDGTLANAANVLMNSTSVNTFQVLQFIGTALNNGLAAGNNIIYGINGTTIIQAATANSYTRYNYAGFFKVSYLASLGFTASSIGAYGIQVELPAISGAGTISIGEVVGINIANQGTNKTPNSYGLRVASQSGATSSSFAIQTNNGLVVFNEAGDSASDVRVEGDTDINLLFTDASTDAVGVGINAPAAKLHIDQSSTTGAKPVLTVDQADVSEEFIRFIGTSANAVLTQSVVEAADVTTFTPVGYLKIYVQDDGNQVADGAYYLQFGTIA